MNLQSANAFTAALPPVDAVASAKARRVADLATILANAYAKPRTPRRVDAALFAELELLNAVAKMFGDDLGEHRDYLTHELGTDADGYPVGEGGERTGEPA